MLLMSYAPFAAITNHTAIPLTLAGNAQHPARIEFDQPKLGLRFKRIGPTHAGFVTSQSVPLDQMYVLASGSPIGKRFTMKLFAGVAEGTPAGAVVVAPGQTLVFGPWLPSAGFENVLDWRSDKTASISCVPGWNGPSLGYCVDLLAGSATLVSAVNGNLRIIPTRVQDQWDVEIATTGVLNGCRVFRPTTEPSSTWPWEPEASLEVNSFPANLSDFQQPVAATSMFVNSSATIGSWPVKPIFSVVLPPASTQLLLKDANHNGIDDEWQSLHFPSQTVAPDEDPDGDGHSNLSEFLVGSSPVDAGDFIRTSLLPEEDGKWRLEWSSSAQRSYVVESSEDLSEWTSLATVTAVATTCSYPIGNLAGNARYFRLRIIPPI